MGCSPFRRPSTKEQGNERRPVRPKPTSDLEPDGTSPVLVNIEVDGFQDKQQGQTVPLSHSQSAVIEGQVKPEAANHNAQGGGVATAQPPGQREAVKPRVDCWRSDDTSRRQGPEGTSAARGKSADKMPAHSPNQSFGQGAVEASASAARRPSSASSTPLPRPESTGVARGKSADKMPAHSPEQGSVERSVGAVRRPSSASSTPLPRRRVSDAGSKSKAMPKQADHRTSRPASKNDGKGAGKGKKPDSANDLDEHEQNLMKEVLDAAPGVSWDSIAGLDEVKRLFWEIVVAPVKNPALFSGVRAPPRGVLLFGPPGNGKTMLAKAVATECDATFFSISASSLTSKWVGESEKQMRALFSLARKLQPSIIFIDEIDSMLTSRASGEHEASRRLKTEFLVQVDGAGTSAGGSIDRVLVLGATNRPGELDDAALRRLTRRILIPLPDAATRAQLVSKELQGTRHAIEQKELTRIASLTEHYSCSDLAALTREAAMGPVRGLSAEALVSATPDSVRLINVADFEAAARKVRPSLSKEALAGFQDWNRRFGSS